MEDKTLKKIRDIVALELKNALRLLTMQQSTTNHKLDLIYKRLETVEEGVDALTVDVHQVQEDVKGLYSYKDEVKDKQERRFKEIKEDLGLQTS